MNWLYLIAGILATFRLSLLVSAEDGPAWIFRKLRNAVPKKSSAHQGIRCIWCCSAWMGMLVATAYWLLGLTPGIEWPLWALAFSAGAIAVNQQWIAK